MQDPKFLENKYKEDFVYVKKGFDDFDFFMSEDKKEVVAYCDRDKCTDNYYAVANREKYENFIYNILSNIKILPSDYKFYLSDMNVCDNKILKDTPLEDAIKIDSRCFNPTIHIYVKENFEIKNENELDEAITNEFKKYGLLGTVEIYLTNEERYSKLYSGENKCIKNYDDYFESYKDERIYYIYLYNNDYKPRK